MNQHTNAYPKTKLSTEMAQAVPWQLKQLSNSYHVAIPHDIL